MSSYFANFGQEPVSSARGNSTLPLKAYITFLFKKSENIPLKVT